MVLHWKIHGAHRPSILISAQLQFLSEGEQGDPVGSGGPMRTSKVMPLRVLIGSQRIASAYSEQRTLAAQFQVISTAPNLQNPPRKAGLDPKPDVILIDMATAIEDGGKVIKNLVRRFPEVRIILYPDRSKLSVLDR